MQIARSIRITGHVQGVFYREWAVRVASELGVAGWVRNLSDGSVEAYAVGEPERVERFIAELHHGSPSAQVDDVSSEPAAVEAMSGFVRRSTA